MVDPFHRPIPSDDEGWLALEHNWLDARLAAAFMKAASGEIDEACHELAAYRAESLEHLQRAQQYVFCADDGRDDRTGEEQREWAAHARELQEAARAVELAVAGRGRTAWVAVEALRRAVRRHREDEARLLHSAGHATVTGAH
jgi:hypothetical protein